MIFLLKTVGLFILTALAEIVGCYLPFLVWKKQANVWLLFPAIISLFLFVYLLTLHPTGAGRTYAAYGGVYIATACVWAVVVEKIDLQWTDFAGLLLCLMGAAMIVLGARQ